eukprot:scaffold4238_cov105-Isochrysis_galbana.AAC.8
MPLPFAPRGLKVQTATSATSSTACISLAASSSSVISTLPGDDKACRARSFARASRTCPHNPARRASSSSACAACAAREASRAPCSLRVCRVPVSSSPRACVRFLPTAGFPASPQRKPAATPGPVAPSRWCRSMLAPRSSAGPAAPWPPAAASSAPVPSCTACASTASMLWQRAEASSTARISA